MVGLHNGSMSTPVQPTPDAGPIPPRAPGEPWGSSEPLAAPARLPLLRPARGRIFGGVCRGVSIHLGVPVWVVRAVFAATTLVFGAGAVAYVFLWMFVPAGDPVAVAAARQSATALGEAPLSYGNSRYRGPGPGPEQEWQEWQESTADKDSAAWQNPSPRAPFRQETTDSTDGLTDGLTDGSTENLLTAIKRASKPSLLAGVGLALILLAAVAGFSGVRASLILALFFGFLGIGVAWLRFNAADGQLGAMLAGVSLLFVGYMIYTIATPVSSAYPWLIVLSGLALLVGVGLAVVPWANAMMRNLGTERVLKEREEQRADMTAHLHDGVLQTLALIQLHSDEPQTVITLAHRQERELRDWLYQERKPSDRSVNAGITAIAAQVEIEHGKTIEVITVGDAQPSTRTDALLDASHQALVNAATHGAEPISLYCEAGDHMIEVFVRDHGNGFDVDHIPEGRLGIRESIIGRVRRRGGTVEIVSRPDWGTEVRMHMPLNTEETSPSGQRQGA